jgi:hypothetical protein
MLFFNRDRSRSATLASLTTANNAMTPVFNFRVDYSVAPPHYLFIVVNNATNNE